MSSSQEPAGAPGMMVWPLVAIGAVLGGLGGAFVTHNLPVAAACALLGAGGVGILAWQAIGRLAQEQEYADWVARRGWQPARNLPAALVTSLLRAGDTRRLEDGFEGEIEGRRAGIGHFIWETVERSVDEYGNVHETRIPHTDTVLETLTGLQSMTRLTLTPRRRDNSCDRPKAPLPAESYPRQELLDERPECSLRILQQCHVQLQEHVALEDQGRKQVAEVGRVP